VVYLKDGRKGLDIATVVAQKSSKRVQLSTDKGVEFYRDPARILPLPEPEVPVELCEELSKANAALDKSIGQESYWQTEYRRSQIRNEHLEREVKHLKRKFVKMLNRATWAVVVALVCAVVALGYALSRGTC